MKRQTARNVTIRIGTVAIGLLLPELAHAHSGDGPMHGLLDGLAHPLTGLDHLAAMIAVGLWAASRGGRAIWMLPTAFVAAMLLGGMLGAAGVTLPFVEPAIVVSVLTFGLVLAAAIEMPLPIGPPLVAFFAMFHGHAHGAELPTGASTAAYCLGFVLATTALQLLGIGLGVTAERFGSSRHIRMTGSAVALFGMYLLLE